MSVCVHPSSRRGVLDILRDVGCALLMLTILVPLMADPASASTWRWPLVGEPTVVRGFDPPAVPWDSGHRGVDLTARPGDPVLAAGAGTVHYAGMIAGRGVVSIAHGTAGLRTTYEPVVPSVHAGQHVTAGEPIGAVGKAPGHCVPRTCLHWGLLRARTYLDPLLLVGRGDIRLLPVWGVPIPYVGIAA